MVLAHHRFHAGNDTLIQNVKSHTFLSAIGATKDEFRTACLHVNLLRAVDASNDPLDAVLKRQ